jgi:hypothetical protein
MEIAHRIRRDARETAVDVCILLLVALDGYELNLERVDFPPHHQHPNLFMTSRTDTGIAIIGAGIAGTLVAEALLERGFPADEVALIDPGKPRASDAPGALMHAIPGRSLDPKEGTMEAFVESIAWHEKWREQRPDLIARSTMTRPDFGYRQGRRYVNTWKGARERYPKELESELLDTEQCAARLPAMKEAKRAVSYGPAYCVLLGDMLEHISAGLCGQGVRSLQVEVGGLGAAAQPKKKNE